MSNTHALREFLAAAAKIGFVLDGWDGKGHPRLRHTASGVTTSVARTPSDHRSRLNELARLERLSGRKLPRDNAAHYRHKRHTISNYTQGDAERAASARVTNLLGRAAALRRQWAALTTNTATRGDAAAARSVLDDFAAIRNELAELHRHIPPITDESEPLP